MRVFFALWLAWILWGGGLADKLNQRSQGSDNGVVTAQDGGDPYPPKP